MPSKIAGFFLLQFIAVIIINFLVFITTMRAGLFQNLQEKIVSSVMANNKIEQTNAVTDKSAITVDSNGNIQGNLNSSYSNEKKGTVDLINIQGTNFKGHMFIISNPKRVKLAVSENIGYSRTKLSDLIKTVNGIGGVNAGGFTDSGGHGNGGQPTGIIVKDGKVVWRDKSESTFSIIGFDRDGILTLGNYTLNQIKELNIVDAVSFGPYLIVNNTPIKIVGDG